MPVPEDVPDLDVVVVLFDSDPHLFRRCVDTVAVSARAAAVRARLVLVDNGGALPPLDDLPLPHVLVGTGQNLGFGTAVNAAVRCAEAAVTLLLNPDAALHEDSLRELLAAVRRRPGSLVCGSMNASADVPDLDDLIDWDFSLGRLVKRRDARRALPARGEGSPDGLEAVEKVTGGALVAETGVLRRFGPFDERFFLYCEDADLSRRARRAGVPLVRARHARVDHARSASARSHAELVEAARADAAIRVTAYHRPYAVSLLQRFELALVTITGACVEQDAQRRAARLARLASIRRWGLRRELGRFEPEA